jgi:hypothetical protein
MPHFFATKNDIIPVLRGVEGRISVKYVKAGRSISPIPQIVNRGEDIPNLGTAPGESHTSCPMFLICDSSLKLKARPIGNGRMTSESSLELEPLPIGMGERTYSFDQMENPDTISFQTGGLWKDILLYGRFATCTATFSLVARKLLQRYTYQVRKEFKYIGAYYVGQEAEEMLKQGKRLTLAEQTPKSFDLQIPT